MPASESESENQGRSPDLVESFRAWYAYERRANQDVLAALDSVPTAGRSDPAFQRAVDIFAHMIAARHLWLRRLGGLAEGPDSLFPTGVPAEDLPARLEPVDRAWGRYLDSSLHEHELGRRVRYTATEGDRFESGVADILTQLFGHGWYHRGQIAMLVRQAGGEPAVTDLVVHTRCPAD